MYPKTAMLACTLALPLAAPGAHAQAPAPRAQVMILGTHHLDNPGRDHINPDAGDVLAPARQAQIEAVARALAEFRPTRIAIEAEPKHDSLFNVRYRDYVAGRRELTRDEREQFGFRLARMMGHERVYLVDHQNAGMDVGALVRYAAENGQGELAQRMGEALQAIGAEMARTMESATLGEILAHANSARADSMHGWYMVLGTIGRDGEHPGAQAVADWYARNLYIFANVARVAQPGERVLVIVGSGHGTLLRQFIGESPDLDLAPAAPYLDRFLPRTAAR